MHLEKLIDNFNYFYVNFFLFFQIKLINFLFLN